MAKKKEAAAREEKLAAAEYYKLNVQAVEDLVTADESNSPVVSEAELEKYRSGSKIKLAQWLKISLIKAWFAGAVCFFFLWGLGNYVQHQLDRLFILGLALGFVTDLLTNNLLHFMEKTPGAHARWMMFPKKGFMSLPLNVLYAFLVLSCVVTTYNVLNMLLIALLGLAEDAVPLGVEPIFFGVLTLAWDTLFIRMKLLLRSIVEDAKRQARRG